MVVDVAAARPSGPLSTIVAAHHGYRVHDEQPARHLGLPSPWLTLIFTLDDPLVVAQHADPRAGGGSYLSLAGGLHTTPAVIEHDGRQSGVQLQLDPLGARALFGLPAGELAGRDLSAAELLGRRADDLQEQLRTTVGWSARFALLDRHLGRLVIDGEGREPAPDEVVRVWSRLRRCGGRIAVGVLAREVGWSERHLTNRFRREFGLTPKVAARVIRFDRARRLLERGNAAQVAADCGYADQSHLVREFHAFTGLSPSRWLAAEVGNVQVVAPDDRPG